MSTVLWLMFLSWCFGTLFAIEEQTLSVFAVSVVTANSCCFLLKSTSVFQIAGKVCENAVYYSHTQNVCGTMDTSHPQQMPYWWLRGSYVTNFSTFEMESGHYSRGFSHTTDLVTVNVATLYRCKLYVFLHKAPLTVVRYPLLVIFVESVMIWCRYSAS